MQGFAPPVVGGNVEPRNSARLVDELTNLFVQGHAMNDVSGALLGRKAGIEIGGLLLVLRMRGENGGAQGKPCSERSNSG